MSEKKEKAESDLRDYGMEYDQRLSLRVHKRQIRILDAAAAHDGKSRTNLVRDMINSLGKILDKKGVEY